MNITDAGMYVQQPRFCGRCGTPLLVIETERFDRFTGKDLDAETIGLRCRDGHEEWRKNHLGAWGLT